MAEVVWRLSPSWTVDRASKVPGSVKLPAVELIEIYMCLTTHQGAKNTTHYGKNGAFWGVTFLTGM